MRPEASPTMVERSAMIFCSSGSSVPGGVAKVSSVLGAPDEALAPPEQPARGPVRASSPISEAAVMTARACMVVPSVSVGGDGITKPPVSESELRDCHTLNVLKVNTSTNVAELSIDCSVTAVLRAQKGGYRAVDGGVRVLRGGKLVPVSWNRPRPVD